MSLALFHRILTKIRETLGVPTVIAGGAIRDHLNKKPFKDIDVFFRCQNREDFLEKISMLKTIYGEPLKDPSVVNEDYQHTGNQHVMGVADFKVRFSTPLQVIGYRVDEDNFGLNVVKTFDFGINRTWLDEDIHKSPPFLRDISNREITLLKCYSPQQLLKSVEKFKRLTEDKYKGFNLNYEIDALHAHR